MVTYPKFQKRTGTGILETKNGTTIETNWTNNIKHGGGSVICSDGYVVASDNLFKNNNPALTNGEKDSAGYFIRNKIRAGSKAKYHVQDNRKGIDDSRLMAYLNNPERQKAISIKIHAPSHHIDLSPYITKLIEKRNSLTNVDFENGSQGRNRLGSILSGLKNNGEWENYLQQEEKFLRFEIIRSMCQLKVIFFLLNEKIPN